MKRGPALWVTWYNYELYRKSTSKIIRSYFLVCLIIITWWLKGLGITWLWPWPTDLLSCFLRYSLEILMTYTVLHTNQKTEFHWPWMWPTDFLNILSSVWHLKHVAHITQVSDPGSSWPSCLRYSLEILMTYMEGTSTICLNWFSQSLARKFDLSRVI